MIEVRQAYAPSRARRGTLLLILAVLAGVVAMHGLAPGGMSPIPAHGQARGAASAVAPHGAGRGTAHDGDTAPAMAHPGGTVVAAVPGRTPSPCGGMPGSEGSGGHAQHADAMCAAAGVATAYVPPALVPGAVTAAVSAGHESGRVTSALTGRSPPDLAQLQLLRI